MRLIDAHDIEYEYIYGEFRVSENKINAMPTIMKTNCEECYELDKETINNAVMVTLDAIRKKIENYMANTQNYECLKCYADCLGIIAQYTIDCDDTEDDKVESEE